MTQIHTTWLADLLSLLGLRPSNQSPQLAGIGYVFVQERVPILSENNTFLDADHDL